MQRVIGLELEVQHEPPHPERALWSLVDQHDGASGMPGVRDIVPAMTYRAVLRGYLLEEALAWLLRNTGYRLLVHKNQDPDELVMKGDTLFVQGRGTTHQVDVLGESALTPAFSLPIRMFIEASSIATRGSCPQCATRTASSMT